MSAAPAKMPLAARKNIKDSEENKQKELEKIAAATGFPVTFNIDTDALYFALAGKDSQANFYSTAVQYLGELASGLTRQYKDALFKEAFSEAWTNHNISIHVFPVKEWEKIKGTKEIGGDLYCGLRFINGELQIVVGYDRWWSNISYLDHTVKYADVIPVAADALPVSMKKAIADCQEKIDEEMEKFKALKGLSDIKLDLDAKKMYYGLMDDKKESHFRPGGITEYLDAVRRCVEKHWADEMVQEAILEQWTAPHTIVFTIVKDKSKEKGTIAQASCSALRLGNGPLEIVINSDKWWYNVNDTASCDFIPLL